MTRDTLIPVAIFTALAGATVFAVVTDEREWREFSSKHACHKVAHIRGDIQPVTTVGANGQVQFGTVSTPSKTGWLCDDGVTYYR